MVTFNSYPHLIGKYRNSVIEELEIGQPYRLDNGLEVTSVKKPKNCFKKVRNWTLDMFHVNIFIQASEGDILVLHYVGRKHGPDGEIFDETRPRGFAYKFEVGGGRAIQGLDLGMRGVCKGEIRNITMPPDLW